MELAHGFGSGLSHCPVLCGPNLQAWYRPTFAPEQGTLLVLTGAIVTGAALSQSWTTTTTLVCLCGFCSLQVEHPLVVLWKTRRWKPRFILWAALYGTIAVGLAAGLTVANPMLLWLLAVAIVALAVDLWAVSHKRQKSIANEMVMFAAICLATPLAFGATTGTLTPQAIGLWGLNLLFFATTIFSMKYRKGKVSLEAGATYQLIAVLAVFGFLGLGCLQPWTALVFAIAPLKFGLVVLLRNWYRTCRFGAIARFETYFTLIYIALVSLTVLPPRLPVA